jgi:hypothetical protein
MKEDVLASEFSCRGQYWRVIVIVESLDEIGVGDRGG